MSGKLVIVPTPIGNLGDISERVREALASADAIFAEDTRVMSRLLSALDISGIPIERLDENLLGERADEVIARVIEGATIAYASDAGMPGVSDPGLRLVHAAREAGAQVEVLPGPSAAITAYVASGITCPQFYFGGFFPRKSAARRDLLTSLAALDAALIFYESPNRLVSALQDIAVVFPHRTMAVCRELTKLHEEVVLGLSQEVLEQFEGRDSIKGEVVLVIDAPAEQEALQDAQQNLDAAAARARHLVANGASRKDVTRELASDFNISRNQAYDLYLEAKD